MKSNSPDSGEFSKPQSVATLGALALFVDKQEVTPAQVTALKVKATKVFSSMASATGLAVEGRGLTKEDLLALFDEIGTRRSANYWQVLDLAEEFAGRFGDPEEILSLVMGWTVQRAQQVRSTLRQYAREDRIPGLYIQHYFEVAHKSLSREERLEILVAAANSGVTSNQLRLQVTALLKARGEEGQRKITGNQLINAGADAAGIIDDQAKTIAEQQAALADSESKLEEAYNEIADALSKQPVEPEVDPFERGADLAGDGADYSPSIMTGPITDENWPAVREQVEAKLDEMAERAMDDFIINTAPAQFNFDAPGTPPLIDMGAPAMHVDYIAPPTLHQIPTDDETRRTAETLKRYYRRSHGDLDDYALFSLLVKETAVRRGERLDKYADDTHTI